MFNNWLLVSIDNIISVQHAEGSAVSSGAQVVMRWRSTILVAVLLLVMSGIVWGLYQSLFFRFASFYDFRPTLVGLIFSVFYIANSLVAIPSSLFLRRFGYKLGFLLGLCAFAIAAFIFYQAVVQRRIDSFLIAVAMMGTCNALLDTSLNPLVIEAGNPSTSVVRLNIAHIFNALGLCAGYFFSVVLFGDHFEVTLGGATPYSARPYLLIGLGAMLLAYYVEHISLPSFVREGKTNTLRHEIVSLFRDRTFFLSVVSVFSCCAVMMILWASHYKYHVNELPGHVIMLFERGWVWLIVGRIVGCVLMRWVAPMCLFRWCICLSIIAVAVAAVLGGVAGWVSLLSVSALFSILYPTIIGYALDRYRAQIRLVAGLLVAAGGIGSAVFAVSTNFALEVLSVNPRVVICFALPLFAVIFVYARTMPAARRTYAEG